MTHSAYRANFPHAEGMVYLDHASTGPLSTPVMEAIQAYLEQRHRTKPNNFFDLLPTINRGRTRIATLLGCDRERIEYAPNTSYGLNVLALGFPWKAGDRVAVPDCEFPGNVQPWLGLLERYGVEVDFISTRDGAFTIADVEQKLRPETRVLAVSWVQFLSGFRCDLSALVGLAHANGTLLAVDAIQGLGALQLNVQDTGVDFLASGGQKWMLATQGSAFVYVSEEIQDRLLPVRGWMNGPVDWDDFGAFTDKLHPNATRFRVGTINSVGCVALDAALGLYLEAGPAWVEERVLANARKMADGLDAIGMKRFGSRDANHASGIVTVEVPEPEAMFAHLEKCGIHIAVRDRKLRFAAHAYNSGEEIDRTLDACRDYVLSVIT